MKTEKMGLLTFIPVEELTGHDVGYKYFDNEKYVYVGPEVFDKIKNRTIGNLRFAVLSYRSNQRPIHLIADELNELMKNASADGDINAALDILENEQARPDRPSVIVNKHKMRES